jgi:hypothetical protein
MTIVELAQVISNLGVIGVLLWFTRAFLEGDILSKSIVDQLVNIYAIGVKDSTDRLCKSLETLATSLDARMSSLEDKVAQCARTEPPVETKTTRRVRTTKTPTMSE